MKILRNAIVVVAALLLVGVATAQGGGGGGQRRGGFGGMMNDAGSMLQRPDVKGELKLSDDEVTKVKTATDKMNSERREMFQNANGDFQSAIAEMTKKGPAWEKDIFAALSADHLKRLKELMVQRSGNQIALNPNFQGDLGVTDAQKTKLNDLQTKSRDAMMSLFQKVRSQEMTMEEMQADMKKNTETLDSEVGKILTDDQKSKMKTMAGTAFKFEDNNGGL